MGDIFSGTDSGGLWLDVPPPVVQVNFPIEVVPGSKVAHTALYVQQLPAPTFPLRVFPFPDFRPLASLNKKKLPSQQRRYTLHPWNVRAAALFAPTKSILGRSFNCPSWSRKEPRCFFWVRRHHSHESIPKEEEEP